MEFRSLANGDIVPVHADGAKPKPWDRSTATRTRERSRKRHRDRIAAGLCTRCGRQQVSNGSTVCEPCREARRVFDGERRDKGRKNEASRRRYAHRRAMNACKGRLVYVAGKMQTRRWRRDGEDSDRFSTEILLVPGSWTAPGPPTARPRRKPRRPRNGSAMPDASAPAQADEMDRIPF